MFYLRSLRIEEGARDSVAESSVLLESAIHSQIVDDQRSILGSGCDVVGVGRE